MRMAEQIERKLREALNPTRLEIFDDSHKHEGHSGWRPGGETHFRIVIVSDAFHGRNRVERQRLVYGTLSQELTDSVHALQLTTRTPAEDDAA